LIQLGLNINTSAISVLGGSLRRIHANWGSSNHVSGNTTNKWTKIADLTLSGNYRAFKLWINGYGTRTEHLQGSPFIAYIFASVGFNNAWETPDIWLKNYTTKAGCSVKNIAVIRRSQSGTDTQAEIWIQFGTSWMTGFPVDVNYWNSSSGVSFTVATGLTPQEDAIPSGFLNSTTINLFEHTYRLSVGSDTPFQASEELDVFGRARIRTIDNGSGDFATISGTGVITRRSSSQVLSDISAAASSVTISAGNGLTGGGDLTANRTITLGGPGSVTLSSTNAVTTDSHTHAFAPGGTTSQYITGAGTLVNFPTNLTPAAHVLATTTGLGSEHTVSGLTAGQVLRATGATTAAFQAIADADLPSTIVRTSRTITAGTALTGGGNLSANITINHANITRANTSSSSSPAFGGTFSTISSVTSDSQGHVTGANTLTVTLPSLPANITTGTGVNGRVTFWTGTNTQSSDGNLFWDNTNKRLGVGTASPNARLHISGNTRLEHVNSHIILISSAATENNKLWYIDANNNVFRIMAANDASTSFSNVMLVGRTDTTINSVTFPNGNVGIGLTAPNERLEVVGNIHVSGGNRTIYNRSNNFLAFGTNNTERVRILAGGDVGIGTTTPTHKLEVNGSFAATTKSFVIPHPTKRDKKLQYGSLEGPENGVYVRGRLSGTNVIELPDYWVKLVDLDSVTVQLTPTGRHQPLFVLSVDNNKVYIANASDDYIDCYYFINAERIDVAKLEVEI